MSNKYPGADLSPLQLLEALNANLILTTNITSARTTYDLAQLTRLHHQVDRARTLICGLRNAFSSINKLPSEILVLVFQHLVNRSNRHPSQPPSYTWLSATHVCRYWRDTALSFSSLWSNIDYSSPQLASMFLERSNSVSLNVRISPQSSRYYKTLPVWLASSIPRMRALELKCSEKQLTELSELLSTSPTPLLKYLNISTPTPVEVTTPHQLQLPRVRNFPSIEHLVLRGPAHYPLINRFGNLVTLKLVGVEYDHVRFTLPNFLDVLESNPRISSIHLKHISREGLEDFEDAGIQGRVVTLNHLEKTTFFDCPIYQVLPHLTLGSSVRLRVDLPPPNDTRSLLDIFPRSIENLHILQRIEGIYYRAPKYITNEFDVISVAAGILKLCFLDAYKQSWGAWFAPISLVHLLVLYLRDVDLSKGQEYLLPSLPVLQRLTLDGCDDVSGFFRELHPHSDVTFCPMLQILEFRGEKGQVDDIFDLARTRKANGTPFKKMVIRSVQVPSKSVIAALGTFVEEVDWKPRSKRETSTF